MALVLVAGLVTPAFADPANLGTKDSPASLIPLENAGGPSSPAAFLPFADFTVTDAVVASSIDCFSFDATSVGFAAGDFFFAAIDNNIGGPIPDTVLGEFSAAGCTGLLATNDDSSPLGSGLGSALSGIVQPDGFIYLGVTGFSDFGFNGNHGANGAYDLSVVLSTGDGNDALTEAELVSPSQFTSPEPADVTPRAGSVTATITGIGGGDDVDFYQFSFCNEETSLIADLDNNPLSFDPILSLFNSDGTLIAEDDDTFPIDAGSVSSLDSFIGQITLAPGTYYVAVSQFSNFANALCVSSSPLDIGGAEFSGCDFGDSSFREVGADIGLPYNLHLSLQGGDLSCLVGGEFLPIDSTALILAGAQTNAVWLMSALAVIGSVAFSALYITSKKN